MVALQYVKSLDDLNFKERDGVLCRKVLLEMLCKRIKHLLVVMDGLGIEWVAGGELRLKQMTQLI